MSYNPKVKDYAKCVEKGIQTRESKIMVDIKTELIQLGEGESYTSKDGNSYVINDKHTIADICRWCLTQASASEWIEMLKEV
jgi:hypothetical protein